MTKRKVMLVEDDATMQAVLTTLLEIEGFQVVVPPERANLDGLIQAIHDSHADVILLDVHLRQISGLDVLKGIRTDTSTCSTRVVMSSGMDVKDACMQGGADAFLMKPFMPDDLLAMLRG